MNTNNKKTVLHCMSALYIMVMVTDGVMRKRAEL